MTLKAEKAQARENAGPRAFLLAGAGSGAGKTTMTLGLCAAFARKGLRVQPFKCGPDFIDPSLHLLATGRPSPNLDLWMCGAGHVRRTFQRRSAGADLAVVEGMMGLFDGGAASGAALAQALAVPVILVADASGLAESAAALVKGFETLEPGVRVAGVIFNNVGGPGHYEILASAVRSRCRALPLGWLPRRAGLTIPDRHLGLHMGHEHPLAPEALDELCDLMIQNVDLDALLALSSPVPPPPEEGEPAPSQEGRVRIGVARDEAFCFYYEENLEALARAGAELVPLSPLRDSALPAGLCGLYLGGGYPELHAPALSANRPMREAIRAWALSGRPLYAECGGFMALTQGIEDAQGRFHPMAGVFPVRARMNRGLCAIGYREATLAAEAPFGPPGLVLRGHEFHHSAIDPMPEAVERVFRLADGRLEGYRVKNTLAGYLHLHFGSAPGAARNFVRFCRDKGAAS